MSVRNKFVKRLGYVMVGVITFIESYLIALVMVMLLSALVCMVWSFITPLPLYIAKYYGVLVLQGAFPISAGVMTYILIKIRK